MCLKLMGNNPLFLCLPVGVSTVLILEVILGCLENSAMEIICPYHPYFQPGNSPALELFRRWTKSGFHTLFPWGTFSWLTAAALALHISQSITAQPCNAGHAPHLSQLLISCHLALSFQIWVYHCFRRQNPCDSTTTEIKASKENKTLNLPSAQELWLHQAVQSHPPISSIFAELLHGSGCLDGECCSKRGHPAPPEEQPTVKIAGAKENIFRELIVWKIIQAIKSHTNRLNIMHFKRTQKNIILKGIIVEIGNRGSSR